MVELRLGARKPHMIYGPIYRTMGINIQGPYGLLIEVIPALRKRSLNNCRVNAYS